MGFLSRSCSLMRYRVRGETEGPFWDAVDHGVRAGAFRDVESAGDLVGLGWTSIHDFTAAPTDGGGYVVGSHVALSLRVDTARVPPRILEMQVKQATKELLEQTGRTRLSSAQRREVKERVKESLKQRVFPSIQVFDLVWNTALGTVYFGSHGIKPRDYLEDHFKKSFGLTLLPLIGYLRAEEILQEGPSKQLLEALRPSSLVP